jgi:predicted small secreted protein
MIKKIVSVTVAVLSAGALLTGCNFEQPGAGCIVQDASFANWYAKYDLKEGQNLSPACQALVVKGERWGVFKFTDPEKPNSSVLTIRPIGLYSRASRDPGDPYLQNAVGKLAEEPDASNFCAATDFSLATVNASAAGTTPATSISYQFSNVRVYADPRAPGTQIGGDLTYTRDGCTIQLGVRALWPEVPCDPDPSVTNPAEKCGEGSGINPEFAVVCDEALNRCVPAKEIPSLN